MKNELDEMLYARQRWIRKTQNKMKYWHIYNKAIKKISKKFPNIDLRYYCQLHNNFMGEK